MSGMKGVIPAADDEDPVPRLANSSRRFQSIWTVEATEVICGSGGNASSPFRIVASGARCVPFCQYWVSRKACAGLTFLRRASGGRKSSSSPLRRVLGRRLKAELAVSTTCTAVSATLLTELSVGVGVREFSQNPAGVCCRCSAGANCIEAWGRCACSSEKARRYATYTADKSVPYRR